MKEGHAMVIPWKAILQITAAALTLNATIFLLRSSIALSAEDIAALSTAKYGHSPEVANNVTNQNVDTRLGLWFLVLAVVAQMADMRMGYRFIDLEPMGAWGYVFFLALSGMLFFGGRQWAKKAYKKKRARVEAVFQEPE